MSAVGTDRPQLLGYTISPLKRMAPWTRLPQRCGGRTYCTDESATIGKAPPRLIDRSPRVPSTCQHSCFQTREKDPDQSIGRSTCPLRDTTCSIYFALSQNAVLIELEYKTSYSPATQLLGFSVHRLLFNAVCGCHIPFLLQNIFLSRPLKPPFSSR